MAAGEGDNTMGMRYTPPSTKSRYYMHRDYYIMARRYALCYKAWKAELAISADITQGVRYDKEKVDSSGSYDATSETAIRRAELSEKVKIIDDILEEVAPGLEDYIRLSVCYGFSYNELQQRGMPVNRNEYSVIRQHFYYELYKRI